MVKSARKLHLIALICVLLLALYITSSVLKLVLLSNISSLLCVVVPAGILAHSYSLSDRKKTSNLCLLAASFACLAWAAANIFWTVYSALGIEPIESHFLTFAYFPTSIFLFAAVLTHIFGNLDKWNIFHLLLDIWAVCSLSVFLFWILFLNGTNEWLAILLKDGFISAASITFDFIIITGILIYLFAIHRCRLPSSAFIFVFGILLFALNDLQYYYIHYNDAYTPDTLTDYIYSASFIIMALGAAKNAYGRNTQSFIIHAANRELKYKWLFLLLFPLAEIIFKGFIVSDIIIYLIIIFAYEALSIHIHLSQERLDLAKKDREINIMLENRIREQSSRLTFLANYDTVTKLYNRQFFINSLNKSIESLLPGEILALIFIDIDRFKTVNNIYGHDIGDKVLMEMSERMLGRIRHKAILARLGGDEFALLFKGKHSTTDIENIAIKLIEILGEPICVEKNILHMTVSLGVSLYPTDASSGVSLMKNADIAMYRAKALGYNRCVFYEPFFKESIRKKSRLELMLKKADMEKDFKLFYQPQFSLPEKKLIGAEALITWKNPEQGDISPLDFIPVAEEIDYIEKIGKWVMIEATAQIAEWNNAYSSNLRMSINISPKQLIESDFVETFQNIIESENLCAGWLDAEITENSMLESGKELESAFNIFKELSVSVSIDDFGTGYSSWGYLNKYRFNRIKLDKMLIDNLSDRNESGKQVVKAIISMAEAIGVETLAEGVETPEQLAILIQLNCNQAQGFLLGKPVSAKTFEDMFIKKFL